MTPNNESALGWTAITNEMSKHHIWQRQVVVAIVGGIVLLVTLSAWGAYEIVSTGSAQESPSANAGVQEETNQARIEELSQSQDRLVQATLGIVTLVGTGFALLIGFSAIQSNRNAEREAKLVRQTAEAEVRNAVEDVKKSATQAVDQASSQALAAILQAELDHRNYLTRHVDRAKDASLENLQAEANKIQELVALERSVLVGFLDGFFEYYKWVAQNMERSLEREIKSGTNESVREIGKGMIRLAQVGHRMTSGMEANTVASVFRVCLELAAKGTTAMMAGYDVPQQNPYWVAYGNWDDFHNMILDLEKSTHDSHRIEMIKAQYPPDRRLLSPDELQRLVDVAKARKAGA